MSTIQLTWNFFLCPIWFGWNNDALELFLVDPLDPWKKKLDDKEHDGDSYHQDVTRCTIGILGTRQG
jgi:hypothetical protein